MSSVTDSSHEYLEGINMLAVDAKKVTPALLKKLTSSSSVEYVERMPARWTQAAKASKGVDPLLNLQWGLRAIRWFQAKRPKASRIEVAILDTGIDDRHPDFKGVSISYNYKPFRKRDLLGHGTHVAGTVAALANNSIGVAGVADCSLSIWKIFPDEPASDGEYYVDGEAYLRALRSVLDSRIKVVNLSIGGTEKSRTEAMLFRRMYDSGITVCAAMGNDFEYGNPKEYPAGYDGVLSIGSIAENRVRSSFSNTGRHIDLVGPGSNILSTLPRQKSPFYDGTKYGVMSGTSMATPHVAGAAALAVKKYPTLNALGIKKKLTKTQKLPMMRGKKWTPSYGAGLLDLSKAL
ncbi:MAG: S8 family serine peptidase [Myxococcota bacterium]